jgi:dTMP kinase
MEISHAEMCTECEVLLYLAARAQHVQEKILPALNRGATVLCDRFADATFAYQGFGRGVDLASLKRLNRYAAAGLAPDCTVLFDLPVRVAWQRMAGMKKQLDRLENGPRRFHERIRRGYLTLARQHPRRFFVIDATRSIETITQHACHEILKRIGRKTG